MFDSTKVAIVIYVMKILNYQIIETILLPFCLCFLMDLDVQAPRSTRLFVVIMKSMTGVMNCSCTKLSPRALKSGQRMKVSKL